MFQFDLLDTPDYIDIIGAGDGVSDDYGFTTSTSESGIVLGFSFQGDFIPSGEHIVTQLYFDINNHWSTTSLSLSDVIISNPGGDQIGTIVCDCID